MTFLENDDITRRVLAALPERLLERPHAATRYLYMGRKPGRLTVVMQQHSAGSSRRMRLQAFPSALDTDREFKRREDYHIYAATYVAAGTARVTYIDDSDRYELRPGSMFQYNGHTMQELRLEPDDGFTECSFSLDGVTGRHLLDLGIWDDTIRVARVGLHAAVARSYLELFNAALDHAEQARALLRKLTQLLEQLYAFASSGDADTLFRNRACGLIASNLSPRFTMRQAAALVGMPYDSFRHRFKRLVGMAPIEYQLRCRIEQACLLLQHHSVKEAAGLLDYADPFVFSRQFKRLTGFAPREYQHAVRSAEQGARRE